MSASDLVPFAVPADLSTRLGIAPYTGLALAQVQALLGDASDHLREAIGQDISAQALTFTTTLEPSDQWVDFPQLPCRSLTAVSINGSALADFELVDQQLYLGRGFYDNAQGFFFAGDASRTRHGFVPVTVSYAAGYTQIPSELKSWTLVLTSQALAQINALGSMGSPGVKSEAIDDYIVGFDTGGAGAAFYLPDDVRDRLRSRYGRGAYITSARR